MLECKFPLLGNMKYVDGCGNHTVGATVCPKSRARPRLSHLIAAKPSPDPKIVVTCISQINTTCTSHHILLIPLDVYIIRGWRLSPIGSGLGYLVLG